MSVTILHCGAPPESLEELTEDRLRCVAEPVDAAAIARRTIDALGEPLGLPPLPQCLTPEDQVAVPVGHGMPAPVPILAGVIASLAAAGIERSKIRVVVANQRDAQPLEEGLAQELEAGVQIETHDPLNDESLCFAGLAKGDKPLLLNRTVFEADFVLPVSAEATSGDIGSTDEAGGPYDGLFPDFFDQHTIDRLRKVRTVNDATKAAARQTARQAEADQAGWMVGAPLVLRAVPGPGGGVASVLAGEPRMVATESTGAGREAWQTPLAPPAEVVLAIISGGPEQQTWASVGRALEAADRLTTPGGVVAVWSDLSEPIGEKLSLLADIDDRDAFAAELAGESGDEALAAWRVLQALERGPVFFHSRLDEDEIESLGLAPVASAEQMLRMVNRFETCTVLTEAQHVNFVELSEASL